MKKQMFYISAFLAALTTLPGCEVIGGIFKAGVWTGVLAVAAVIGLIIFLITKMFGKKE